MKHVFLLLFFILNVGNVFGCEEFYDGDQDAKKFKKELQEGRSLQVSSYDFEQLNEQEFTAAFRKKLLSPETSALNLGIIFGGISTPIFKAKVGLISPAFALILMPHYAFGAGCYIDLFSNPRNSYQDPTSKGVVAATYVNANVPLLVSATLSTLRRSPRFPLWWAGALGYGLYSGLRARSLHKEALFYNHELSRIFEHYDS